MYIYLVYPYARNCLARHCKYINKAVAGDSFFIFFFGTTSIFGSRCVCVCVKSGN